MKHETDLMNQGKQGKHEKPRSCPQNASLLALHAGNDVCPEDVSRLRRHLEDCPDCQSLLAEFRATRDWLRSNGSPIVDARLLNELRGRVVRRMARERPFPWLLALLGRSWVSWRGLHWQSVRGLAVATLLMVGALGALPSLDGRRAQRSAWHATEPAIALPVQTASLASAQTGPGMESEPSEDEDSPSLESDREEEVAEAESPAGGLDAGVEEPSGPGGLRIEMQTTDPNVRIIWFASNTESYEQGVR